MVVWTRHDPHTASTQHFRPGGQLPVPPHAHTPVCPLLTTTHCTSQPLLGTQLQLLHSYTCHQQLAQHSHKCALPTNPANQSNNQLATRPHGPASSRQRNTSDPVDVLTRPANDQRGYPSWSQLLKRAARSCPVTEARLLRWRAACQTPPSSAQQCSRAPHSATAPTAGQQSAGSSSSRAQPTFNRTAQICHSVQHRVR